MKHLLMLTELFRRANITTMYRASLCIALVTKPGITNMKLAALMQTSRESIRVAIRYLENLNLTRTERVTVRPGVIEIKVWPTPYLKDILAQINHELSNNYEKTKT